MKLIHTLSSKAPSTKRSGTLHVSIKTSEMTDEGSSNCADTNLKYIALIGWRLQHPSNELQLVTSHFSIN